MLVAGTSIQIGELKRGHYYVTWRHNKIERNWDVWYHVGRTKYQDLLLRNEQLQEQLDIANNQIDDYEERYGYLDDSD